jgi:hypothetical protein
MGMPPRAPQTVVRAGRPPGPGAARTMASHSEQGWSLLCNGVIVFDDLGEIQPGDLVPPPPHRMAHYRLPAAA